MAKKKVWVVGHKHPDTDSICAAISYANLKNEIEKKNPKSLPGPLHETFPEHTPSPHLQIRLSLQYRSFP